MSLSEKHSILSTLAPGKHEWETVHDAMNHPIVPIRPANYISTVSSKDEDDGNDDVVSLSVITMNLDMLASLPMTTFHSETIESNDNMTAADILLNIQLQAV